MIGEEISYGSKMDNSVLLVLGMLLSSSQGDIGIPNCNLTLCKCQTEKFENEESSLEAKDYIIIALAITSFLLLVVLVMVGCYWKRKRNTDNTNPIGNFEKRLQDKDNSIKEEENNQETNNETRYVEDPTKPEGKTWKNRQSTQRTDDTYDYAVVNIPYPSGEKGENKVEIRKYTEVDATKPYSNSTSNERLALTSSITDECSPFTQEHSSYENPPKTKNDHLERQPCEHDPDGNGACETFNNTKIETNASGGKGNRSNAIPSDIGEHGNEVGTDSDSDSSYKSARDSSASSTESGAEEPCYENLAILKNDDLGNQTREHNPDDDDLYLNSNTIKTVTNVSGGKSNCSGANPSNIGENGNQVGTDSDSDSSYKSARDSSASSTESGAEEPCYENLAILKNDDLGNQTREHNPDDDDLYENSNAIKTVTNVSGGKSNRSGAILSDISENNNQVGTVSDSNSSYETARESDAEASVTGNTPNDQIQASPCIYNIANVNSVTFNIANK